MPLGLPEHSGACILVWNHGFELHVCVEVPQREQAPGDVHATVDTDSYEPGSSVKLIPLANPLTEHGLSMFFTTVRACKRGSPAVSKLMKNICSPLKSESSGDISCSLNQMLVFFFYA